MELNRSEMKLHFQSSSVSLDISLLLSIVFIHYFFDSKNFVPKYFQNPLIEFECLNFNSPFLRQLWEVQAP